MAGSPIVDALTKRYAEILRDDWEHAVVEDVSDLRDRLGMNPHKARDLKYVSCSPFDNAPPQTPTQWAYDQACKALQVHADNERRYKEALENIEWCLNKIMVNNQGGFYGDYLLIRYAYAHCNNVLPPIPPQTESINGVDEYLDYPNQDTYWHECDLCAGQGTVHVGWDKWLCEAHNADLKAFVSGVRVSTSKENTPP